MSYLRCSHFSSNKNHRPGHWGACAHRSQRYSLRCQHIRRCCRWTAGGICAYPSSRASALNHGLRGFAENASLCAGEHFETARLQLNNGGLFLSWIDCYTTESAEVIDSVIGTMKEVFPYVTLWYVTPQPAPSFVIVGSELPRKIPVAHVRYEITKPDVAATPADINIYSIEGL